MQPDNLVRMANDIGHFFEAEDDRELAVEGIANHLRRFWAPRMRTQLIDYVKTGDGGLDDDVAAAVRQLIGEQMT